MIIDNCRVFCIGGFINESLSHSIKAVNWNLEYVKEPCFIQPKNGMSISRYHHCCTYDERRGWLYVLGGVGEENGSIALS
jgi:hypothetical protein